MLLQILIPQYHETEEVIKPLLDSLAIQQGIDVKNDIGAIIVSDGGEVQLNKEFLDSYPYPIEYHIHKHAGVSATRNACLDYATADYVMFCDADDMFYSACGCYIILQEITKNGGFDSLTSCFIEESKNPATNEIIYLNHEQDSTFVHGKVHRRQYLINNKIRWNPNLTIHEDSFFNILCQQLSQNVKYSPNSFYLWKWRDESVCRHDPKYILKTYNNLIDSNTALIDEFLSRGMQDKAMFYTAFMIFDAYYTMNKPEWINQENKQYRNAVENKFAIYYKEHKSLWKEIPYNDKMMISANVRNRVIQEGMRMESVTIDNWLKSIERKNKVKK